jgi:hypothetical protein
MHTKPTNNDDDIITIIVSVRQPTVPIDPSHLCQYLRQVLHHEALLLRHYSRLHQLASLHPVLLKNYVAHNRLRWPAV